MTKLDSYNIQLLTWGDEAQKIIAESNSELYKMLAPGMRETDQFMLASYDFLESIFHANEFYLPSENGRAMPYAFNTGPNELQRFFGGYLECVPFGIVLDGSMEQCLQAADRVVVRGKSGLGSIFGVRNFMKDGQVNLFFKEKWNMVSGSKTLALLPSIKNVTKHKQFQAKYGIKTEMPQSFSEHAELFKALNRSLKTGWNTKVLFFSYSLFERIKTDPAFLGLRSYIHALLWEVGFERDYPFFDFLWHEFIRHIESKGVKEKEYIYNLARHLILVALGAEFAFAPVVSDEVGPIRDFQETFAKIYKLEYMPNFISTALLSNEKGDSVYYSLQYPIHLNPYPSKHSNASGLDDIRSIQNLHEKFFEYISTSEYGFSSNQIIAKIPECAKFEYFHTVRDGLKRIQSSEVIEQIDNRFGEGKIISGKPFCRTSTFFKGCVRIERM